MSNPVNIAYLREAARLLAPLKQQTYRLMRIESGFRVLDAGCGPAIDTLALAALVGPQGKVTGVDADAQMVEAAQAEAKAAGLETVAEHLVGDATRLPFPDEYFDACRAERLLQVLAPSQEGLVVAELARVLKTGQRLVLCDTDWATASVDFSDLALERRLMRFFADRVRPNGYAGRSLLRLAKTSGLNQLEIEGYTGVYRNFAETPMRDWLCREALAAQVATREELDGWKKELDAKSIEGTFYFAANMNIVAGVKGG